MPTDERRGKYAYWIEAANWLVGLFLVVYTYLLYPAPLASAQAFMYVIGFGLGPVTTALIRLLPEERRTGRLRYLGEDKYLVISLVVIAAVAGYVFAVGGALNLMYLLLALIVLAVARLEEKMVMAETVLSLLAIVIVEIVYASGPAAIGRVAVQVFVFLVVGTISYGLAVELRHRSDDSKRLLDELSRRLDQIQAVSVIVKQVEFFSHLDTLLQRIAEALSGVFAARRVGIYLGDGAGGLKLAATHCLDCADARSGLEAAAGQEPFREVLDSAQGRLVSGIELSESGFRAFDVQEMMIAPLRVRDRVIGVAFVANKTNGSFAQADQDFFGTLTDYVATLVDSSQSFQAITVEREKAERMLKLMVSREIRMRDLKNRLDRQPAGPSAV